MNLMEVAELLHLKNYEKQCCSSEQYKYYNLIKIVKQ